MTYTIEGLIDFGEYSSRLDRMYDAFREVFRHIPEGEKTRAAVELYTKEKFALIRAAEIAGMNLKELKAAMKKRHANENAVSEDLIELEQLEERL